MNQTRPSSGRSKTIALNTFALIANFFGGLCFAQETRDLDTPLDSTPSIQAAELVLPSSQQLEAQGAVIGDVRIVNNNVFATELAEENYGLFRLANRLHIRTRENVLRQQLLFKSGDRYTYRLQRESERILRTDRYLYDAEIVPVRYRDGVVDIEVRTRDVWTFKPGIQYGRSGGTSTTGFELQESNLLGFGKEATIGRKSD